MDHAAAFSYSYTQWLALIWQELESIEQRCTFERLPSDMLVPVRLEMLLMEQAAARCLVRQDLHSAQHSQIVALLGDLRKEFDRSCGSATVAQRRSIHAAQDRIFEEVLALQENPYRVSATRFVTAVHRRVVGVM
jgi:hypothetical protein